MVSCPLCASVGSVLRDFGVQPISNRFTEAPQAEEARFPLSIALCESCGLLFLGNPVDSDELVPRFDWIKYDEPEEHLDELVDVICSYQDVQLSSAIAGVSYNDLSTVERFQKRKLNNTWLLDVEDDLGAPDSRAGVEVVQRLLTIRKGVEVAANGKVANVVIARHILEHANNIHEFLGAIRRLVAPGGIAVFEVPDCRRAVDLLDYSLIWEEHFLYFTETTLSACLERHGFELKKLLRFHYPFEDSLVVIASPVASRSPEPGAIEADSAEIAAIRKFAREFERCKKATQNFCENFRRKQGRIAVLGAGHLACGFINLMEIDRWIDFLVDDNSHKQGLFLPGTNLPIIGSQALFANQEIALCLLSINPRSEDRVIKKFNEFAERGGSFLSIFPSSPRSIQSQFA